MKVKIDWVENKSPDWKVATVINESNAKIENVSINRTNKEGQVFPNFDGVSPGADVEGELWQSQAGKWYLFAPKIQKTSGGAMGAKLMEKKEKSIEKFQASKEESIIAVSSARDATLITIEWAKQQEAFSLTTNEDEFKKKWQEIRHWLVERYNDDVSEPFKG